MTVKMQKRIELMHLENSLTVIDQMKENCKYLKIFSNLKMLSSGIVMNVSFFKYETKHYELRILM